MFNNIKDFYPTPESLIHKMLSGVKLDQISTILEPSAGKGDIVSAIMQKAKYCNNNLDIDTIEIDHNLQHILKGNGYKLVHNDFLTFNTYKNYDLIILNPPYSTGDKHLLKALDMQKNGGQVICLLNAETLRNPFSNYRKDLLRKLEEYDAEIEYIQNAFLDAERQTPVEVTLIKVTIPQSERISTIITNLKNEETYEIPVQNDNQLTHHDFLKNITEQYNFEVTAGVRLINEYHAMQKHFLKSLKPGSHYSNTPIITMSVCKDRYNSELPREMINNFICDVRFKYWEALLDSKIFNDLFTSNLRTEYHKKIDDLKNYDFSIYNIERVKLEIISQMTKSVEQTILDLFEKLSNKHHYAEYSKNIHYFNGWKTNQCWKINKRVIIPLSAWSWTGTLDYAYTVLNKLTDIEKVFNYLDNGKTDEMSLSESLKQANSNQQTKKIETKYFFITFYQKGTCHLEFKDLELLKKFNIFGSQRKGWLPPTYGKKSYKDMTPDEKVVVDAFEGEKEYAKTLINKTYYIQETVSPLLLAAS